MAPRIPVSFKCPILCKGGCGTWLRKSKYGNKCLKYMHKGIIMPFCEHCQLKYVGYPSASVHSDDLVERIADRPYGYKHRKENQLKALEGKK